MELSFRDEIQQGIPDYLPDYPKFEAHINRAPKRRDILNSAEKKLAL